MSRRSQHWNVPAEPAPPSRTPHRRPALFAARSAYTYIARRALPRWQAVPPPADTLARWAVEAAERSAWLRADGLGQPEPRPRGKSEAGPPPGPGPEPGWAAAH